MSSKAPTSEEASSSSTDDDTDDDSSSSSDSSDHHRHHHRETSKKRKRHHSDQDKKTKKEKKKKKKEKEKKKRRKLQKALEFLKNAEDKGHCMLTKKDYYNKNAEFILWLKEEKGLFFDEIPSSKKAFKLFDKFVDAWNFGKLSEKYYSGTAAAEMGASMRTRYQWSFTTTLPSQDLLQLGSVCDSISKDTHRKTAKDLITQTERENKGTSRSNVEQRDDNIQQDEDPTEQRARLLQKKQQDYQYKKHKQMVEEELVPKATGRDALIEKKKARREASRADDDDHPDIDVFSNDQSNDYASMLARKKLREAKRTEQKRQETAQLVASYNEREEKTLEAFRQMIGQRTTPFVIPPRPPPPPSS